MKKGILIALALSATPAFADDIRLGQPAYGGNGCPRGTASAVLSPDRKTLSILFDQYTAEAGRSTGRQVDRKSCNIAVPVHVPQGYSISLFQVDYRGFNSLPPGGRSRLTVDYFFAGQRGPTYQKEFRGTLRDDYMLRNTLAASSLVWSPCGADTNLRVNSSMMAQTNGQNEQTIATVDSADIKSGLVYHVQWRRCR
jgi:hypothetical protein